MKLTPRRSFIRKTSLAALGAGVAPAILKSQAGVAPNDQVLVGLIGCRNKGYEILEYHLKHGGVRCTAICDVDQTVLDETSARLNRDYSQQPAQFLDYRQLLESKDLDAVIIGTPDHWHCLPFVDACQAGVDIYVEKPLANYIAECDVMVKATRKYNRIVTVGQQQRSGDSWQAAIDFVKDQRLGTLRKVNIWANFDYGVGRPVKPDEPVPQGVNFDRWLGPAPARSFNPSRFHGSWRMFWDYGGGLMTDWGVHLIDMALWAGDITADPTKVMAYGANLSFPQNAHETYDTMSVTFPVENYVINWEHTAGTQKGPYGRNYGLAFVGDDATLVADRSGWDVYPESQSNRVPRRAVSEIQFKRKSNEQSMQAHVADFIDCVRSRKEPACPIEVGRQVAVFAHLANMAVRSGTGFIDWDSAKGQCINNPAANAFIKPEYRRPWIFPKV